MDGAGGGGVRSRGRGIADQGGAPEFVQEGETQVDVRSGDPDDLADKAASSMRLAPDLHERDRR